MIGYNKVSLGCAITPVYFEPTFTLNGIPILPSGCQALTSVPVYIGKQWFADGLEGKAKALVADLPTWHTLGVKRQETAFPGFLHKRYCCT